MEDIQNSATNYVDLAGQSPIPPAVASASLLYVGMSSPTAIASKIGSSGGSSLFSKSATITKPTRSTCLLFGAANALGGWIIYDGDVTNGAGFTFAWSALYLVVNGRPSMRSMLRGRMSPVALSVLALGNAGIYGKQFFWPSAQSAL
ncbi:hypothetical protein METBIDRAFT_47731 [Metschnikowia bicuspidata var. bicuspidata NRRL YB-4993]|uniref:Altered inheritance of mitochondria protein 19 n=1 Tax=Metschnikowia bicuspidata var. bicuspidata NRRL YB-4993 TaxID=869754 RepID=A0A1A0H286_9ASCO|nr:hypothetical protein METBIDRAFT_47731 [Metschnikowia bicuspidata var. bicuspidata NRRL YB-4993]OBA18065.1 hypothetical protein METBIDRAFT_47731 [Metschnikowia bicuspidata var. bicuspidata NRRL YB-4993]